MFRCVTGTWPESVWPPWLGVHAGTLWNGVSKGISAAAKGCQIYSCQQSYFCRQDMTRYPQADCKDAVPEPWNYNQVHTGFYCCLIVNKPPLVVLFSFTMCTDPKEINAFISSKTFYLTFWWVSSREKKPNFLILEKSFCWLCVQQPDVTAPVWSRLDQRWTTPPAQRKVDRDEEWKQNTSPPLTPTLTTAFIVSDNSESWEADVSQSVTRV